MKIFDADILQPSLYYSSNEEIKAHTNSYFSILA